MKKLIIANWKLQKSYREALCWCAEHSKELRELGQRVELVVCPDLISMALLSILFEKIGVALGAQNCSPFDDGAHTGSVSARSLREIGGKYALIAHAEQQAHCPLSARDIALCAHRALENNITPVICYGVSDDPQVFTAVLRELVDLREEACGAVGDVVYWAYEPAWAIGSGKMPSPDRLADALRLHVAQAAESHDAFTSKFLYGGSVTPEACLWLKTIPELSGVLVGTASLDMQTLKKLVYSLT